MNTRTHNITLLKAKRIAGNQVQLEFTQKCENPHKASSVFSDEYALAQMLNASHEKWKDSEASGRGIYHTWTSGTQADIQARFNVDLSALGTAKDSELMLNIVNPVVTAADGTTTDISIRVMEFKWSELPTVMSANAYTKLLQEFKEGKKKLKTAGAGGARIKSGGEYVYSHVALTFTAEPQHRFLPMDPVEQKVTPAVPQAQVQQAPVAQPAVAPVAQPVVAQPTVVDDASDLPF